VQRQYKGTAEVLLAKPVGPGQQRFGHALNWPLWRRRHQPPESMIRSGPHQNSKSR